jgi:catechol 2,3-dioxygenase-like lactoylglutathione lyase family enzyme
MSIGYPNRRQTVSRVQLALNVPDIDEAVDFYAKLFASEPTKRRPGYANFAIADPPLKLVLFENPGADARLNHLGVEVGDSDAVWDAQQRLRDEGVELLTAPAPVASPSRTRCGSTLPTERGRSTPCSPTASSSARASTRSTTTASACAVPVTSTPR